MKKLAFIAAIFLIFWTFTLSAYAMGGGMRGGMGGGMSGGMGGSGMRNNSVSSLLDWFQKLLNGNAYTNQPDEQIEQLKQQHYEDSTYLKYQIHMKEKELDALLKSTNPDLEKVRALHRDIRELRAEADQEQRNYERKAGKMNPGYRSGGSDSRDSHGSSGRRGRGNMGHGGGMADYDQD
jgi:Spy/CpxP family protein refolding chaperone